MHLFKHQLQSVIFFKAGLVPNHQYHYSLQTSSRTHPAHSERVLDLLKCSGLHILDMNVSLVNINQSPFPYTLELVSI